MRDPEASEPFTDEELLRVLDAAEADPSEWIGPAAKFLAYSGAHICVLSGGWRRETRNGEVVQWYQPPIRGGAVRGDYIYWVRPKNEKPIGMELSRHLKGWLPEWLDLPRPLTRERYWQVLGRVGRSVGLQVNPLRFRHTCAVRLRRMGLSVNAICKRLGVTPDTMVVYVEDPRWVSAKILKDSDW